MAENVEHIFKCFPAICVSSFENSLLSSVPHFLFGLFSCCSVILILYFRYQSSIKCIINKGLFSLCQLLLSPSDNALCHTQAFRLHEVPFIISGLSTWAISVLLRKSFPVTIALSIFPSFILSDSGCPILWWGPWSLNWVLYRVINVDLIYSTHPVHPAPIVEDAFFPSVYSLPFCQNQMIKSVSGSSVPLISMSVFMIIPYCVYYYSSVEWIEIWDGVYLQKLFLLFRIVLVILDF